MKKSMESRPLSPYLKELVVCGQLPDSVAQIINCLPDWKQQQTAVQKWRERLDDPAKEVVAELEKTNRGDKSSLDFLVYLDAVFIKKAYLYLEETFDEYMESVRDDLERFLKEAACKVCAKPITTNRHIDCHRLDDLRIMVSCQKHLQKLGKLTPEDEAKMLEYQVKLDINESRFAAGFLRDGTPWNAPNTYSAIRKAGLSQKKDESSDEQL